MNYLKHIINFILLLSLLVLLIFYYENLVYPYNVAHFESPYGIPSQHNNGHRTFRADQQGVVRA